LRLVHDLLFVGLHVEDLDFPEEGAGAEIVFHHFGVEDGVLVGGVADPFDAVVHDVLDHDGTVLGADQHVASPVFGVARVQLQVHVVGDLVRGDAHHVLHLVTCGLQLVEFLLLLDVDRELADLNGVGHDLLGRVVEAVPLQDEEVVFEVAELEAVV